MPLELGKPVVTPALLEGLNTGQVVVSDVGATIPGVTPASLPRFLVDLARAVAAGKLNADKLVVAVRSSGTKATAEDVGPDLADALWFAWQEIEDDSSGDAKSRLADAAKDALKEQMLTKQHLMECGEGEFFEWCGLVVSKDMWRKKEIRSHTKHVYQQRKFNLLREESEGYAKLATLLNQQAAGRVTTHTAPAVLAEMKSLIGYFDLDPNRCFSVVLDAFSQQPDNEAFLDLLPAFSSDTHTQLLGFHFSRCGEDAAAQRPATPAPRGLYVAAARMVRAGHTSLEALMAHLSPSDEELQKAYEEGAKRMAQGISRIGIISLISAADTAPTTAPAPLAPPGLGLRRDPSGALGAAGGIGTGAGGAGAGAAAQQPRQKTGLTASALELAAASYAAPLTAVAEGNQKLLLLAAFLQIGDWDNAQRLMRWLATLGLSDFAIFPAVGEALCALIGRELQPVYAAAAAGEAGAENGGCAALALPPRLVEMLAVAGQHLYHNVTVLTKLVRVLAALLKDNGGLHPRSKQLHEQALELLTQSVLPALNMLPGNAGLVYEIWRALQQLPYTDRFCIYSDVKEGMPGSPLLTAAARLAETEVRRILRRVTAPANKQEAKVTMRPLGRMLAKIMHSAPLAVAEQLIRQVMGMPGMVTSIVESLKYLTPMAFDVMTFAILKHLASPKKKLKDDGVNLEEWYQWLAAFTGVLCKKHGAEVEVVALLQYVANQLKSSESLDLLVLKEMVATMTGHQAVFDVSEHQLDALAGSDTLKAEVITQGEHRSSDKSLQRASKRLLEALTQGEAPEERLAMPLLVLLAQQRKLIVLQSQSTHLKLIAELYDKCQEVCTQYAEFLQHVLPLEQYAALLPPMAELAHEYRIDPELIFSLYRPLIRGVLPPVALAQGQAHDHEEEGEIAEAGEACGGAAKAGGKAGANGAAPMDEDGQLEAGEVAVSPTDAVAAKAGPGGGSGEAAEAAEAPDAAERWAELEAAVLAMGSGGGEEGGSGEGPTFRGMSPVLYTTFWALQLYDLDVPAARYESTITQLRTDIRITQGDIDSAKRDAQRPAQHFGGHGGFGFRGPPPAEGPGPGLAAGVEQLEKDIERSKAALDKLPRELKEQQANAAAVERRLQREKGAWVVEAGRVALPREFVQFCVLPRMLNSPTDALYCARFLKKLHQLDVPNFNLLTTLNHVMREFGFLVRVCTAREATNFGIFLNEVFALVERWRQADVFARECSTSKTFQVASDKPAGGDAKLVAAAAAPTASTTLTAGGEAAVAPAAAEAANGGDAAVVAAADEAAPEAAPAAPPAAAPAARNVSHREFLNLCHNWQKKLSEDVFSTCLKSHDYMQTKNALLALNRCVKVYPAVKSDASMMIEQLKPIRDKDPREDLKTLARMYCTSLEMQMRDRTRNMVPTREEYAGLPPKKRTARPAASKGGAAGASEGKPSGAAVKSEAGKKEEGEAAEQGQAASGTGKDAAGKAAAGREASRKDSGGREEGRRASDSSKGPALPPGMGVSSRRGDAPQERERGHQQGQQAERRRDERSGATQDGPPGFGSADKLKNVGSTTELRRTGDQAAQGGERDRRERDRVQAQQAERVRAGREDRPPRPSAAGREEREKEQKDDRKGTASLRPEAAAFVPREGRPSSGSARAAEEPAGTAEREAKRTRREEPSAAAATGGGRERDRAERSAERAERSDRAERPSGRAVAAAGEERERERSSRDRPTSRDPAGDSAAAKAERDKPATEQRQRGSKDEDKKAAAAEGERAERGSERGQRERRDRPTSGDADGGGAKEKEKDRAAAEGRRRAEEEGRREAGAAIKRKREREGEPAAAEQPSGRAREAGDRQQPSEEPARDRRAGREGGGSGAAEDKGREGRSRRSDGDEKAAPAAGGRDVEDARAAARAAAAASDRHPRGSEDREKRRGAAAAEPADQQRQAQQPRDVPPDRKGSGGVAEVAGADSGSDSGGGSSSSGEGRSRGKRKRGAKKVRKEKRKKDKEREKEKEKERKERKPGKRERTSEREGVAEEAAAAAAPAAAAAQEVDDGTRDSKRQRRDRVEPEPTEVPERLRGRLGKSSSLLGAALKGITHDQRERRESAPGREEPAAAVRDDAGRSRREGGRQEERRVVEEGPRREVREVRDTRDGRRGGRNRR